MHGYAAQNTTPTFQVGPHKHPLCLRPRRNSLPMAAAGMMQPAPSRGREYLAGGPCPVIFMEGVL
jgi:hypothetical protein